MGKELDDMEPVFSTGDPVIDSVSGKTGRVSGMLSTGEFLVNRSDGPLMVRKASQLSYDIKGFVYEPDVEKVARILMKSMGCRIQTDEEGCDDDPDCGGHSQFTYCAVHDYEDDWMDWNLGRLCLYAKDLALDLVKEGVK